MKQKITITNGLSFDARTLARFARLSSVVDKIEFVMPIEIKDSDNGLVVIFTGSRIVAENEYLDIYKQHLTQERDQFRTYKYSLNDWTAVTEVAVSSGASLRLPLFA